jgi:hypothetical protein
MPKALNSREWAVLIWLAVVVLAMLFKRDLRSSLATLLRALVAPKLFGWRCLLHASSGLLMGAERSGSGTPS